MAVITGSAQFTESLKGMMPSSCPEFTGRRQCNKIETLSSRMLHGSPILGFYVSVNFLYD